MLQLDGVSGSVKANNMSPGNIAATDACKMDLVGGNFPVQFFLNNLPMTTITVLLAWKEVRDRALQAESMLAELPGKTAEELTALEEEDEGLVIEESNDTIGELLNEVIR